MSKDSSQVWEVVFAGGEHSPSKIIRIVCFIFLFMPSVIQILTLWALDLKTRAHNKLHTKKNPFRSWSSNVFFTHTWEAALCDLFFTRGCYCRCLHCNEMKLLQSQELPTDEFYSFAAIHLLETENIMILSLTIFLTSYCCLRLLQYTCFLQSPISRAAFSQQLGILADRAQIDVRKT